MRRPTNNDVSNRELSVEELEAIAAGFTLWGWLGSELTTLVNNTQVIYASKIHPPLPKRRPLPQRRPVSDLTEQRPFATSNEEL